MYKGITVALLISFTACISPPPLKTGLEGTKLPSFNLLLKDSVTIFPTSKLPVEKPVVLFYFSPECPYCRAATEYIITNMESLENIEFCLLTPGAFSDFINFYEEYHLEKYENIVAGVDYDNFFGEYFDTQTVPYMAIYNNKVLKQVLIGNKEISKLKDIIITD